MTRRFHLDRLRYIVQLRLRSLFHRSRVDHDLDEELQVHLAFRTAQEIAAGRTPDEARRIALRAMDGLTLRKEECRDMRRTNLLDNLIRDLRYSVRTLSRTPAFTAAALLALALGIGANTAVFSVVNHVLLNPLPYRDSARLVAIYDSFQQQGLDRGPAGIADLLDWRARAHSFESLEAAAPNRFTLVGDGDAEQVVGIAATAGFFDTLGIRPTLGRAFSPGDDQPGRPLTAVISDRLWRRRYASNPAIIGKSILLNGRLHTVIGVAPASFHFGGPNAEVWAILTLTPPGRRGPFFLLGLARLKPGVAIDQAAAEMAAIAYEVEGANRKDYAKLRFPVRGLRDTAIGDVQPLLLVFTGAVALVFLIAVSNVANLMLARAATRRREIAVRLCIGAGRGQLFRQFITESLLLSLAGGALGVLLAYWGVGTLRWLKPSAVPRLSEIALDARALVFTLLASIAAAILFGLAPAFAAGRTSLSETMNQSGRGGESRTKGRARGALVIAQVTLSVLLLIGAGLLIRSFNLLGRVNPGFQAPPDRILTMLISPTGPRYREAKALAGYWKELLDRVQHLPGIESASVSITIPPDRIAFTDSYEIEEHPLAVGVEHPAVPVVVASRDYFRTLGIPLLRGRWFDERDREGTPDTAVISDSFARREFPGESPVGKRLKRGGHSSNNPYMEIIGVVGDAVYQGPDNGSPVYYEATEQAAMRPMWLIVRTRSDAHGLIAAIRGEIRAINPDVPVDRVSDMSQALADSVSVPRFRSLVMSVFAALALLLAAIGIYSVIAYTVTQRTQEIGVRMALGATRARVLSLALGQSGRLTAIGMALGVGGALALTGVLKNMLFGVKAWDGFTFVTAMLILGAVAAAASLAPAFRAARIDPVNALRHE